MLNPIQVLSFVETAVTRVEKVLLSVSLISMLLLAATQVLLRNVFNSGFEFADVIIRHLVLFLLFFGASLSTRDRRHLQMDISGKLIPAKFRPAVNLVIDAVCLVVNILLLKAAYVFVRDEKAVASILFGNLPTWTVISIMPIGFGLMSFRFFVNIIDNILVLCGKKAPPAVEHIPIPVRDQ